MYLEALPQDERDILQKLRRTIKSAAPESKERIAYKIVVFSLNRDLVGFASQKNHCSFYTMSPKLVKSMNKKLQSYKVSGATIHFTPEKPLPESLVKKIVQARVKES